MSDANALSRRQFLLGKFRRAAEEVPEPVGGMVSNVPYPRSKDELLAAFTGGSGRRSKKRTIPVLRPPGAVEESTFLRDCTKCGDCIEACPPQALVQAPLRFRQAAGTPMLDPAKAPCDMCADTPCITVCKPGVLSAQLPVRMGTARIDTQVCLAYQGSFCSTCRERCPVPQAIQIESGRPIIDEDACTGCGVCHYVCPAPQNAVAIMPVLARPQLSVPSRSVS